MKKPWRCGAKHLCYGVIDLELEARKTTPSGGGNSCSGLCSSFGLQQVNIPDAFLPPPVHGLGTAYVAAVPIDILGT